MGLRLMQGHCKKNLFLQKWIRRIFPVITWLPQYTLTKFRGDFIAGIAVGLVTVAHGVALGTIAGLPPQYGLYSAFPAGVVYFLMGTAKDMHIGPTVLQAIFTKRYVPSSNPIIASALAMCSGSVMLLIGALNLGQLMNFISYPVVGGFVSAAALVITISQMKYILGISDCPRQTVSCVLHLFSNLDQVKLWECILGFGSLAILTALQFCKRYIAKPLPQDASRLKQMTRGLVWFVIVARSAIVPIASILLSYSLTSAGHKDVFLTPDSVPKGLPVPMFPLQEISLSSNSTLSPLKMIGNFGSGLIVVPLLAILEHVAVAKALSTQNNYRFHSSQEFVAVGLGNMMGSLFRAFPVTGSFGRSAINSASGAVTPAAGLVISSIVLLALWLVAPVFAHIPLTVLAAIVISACLSMIDLKLPLHIWRTNRIDMIPYLVALLTSFYELEFGIFAGIGVSLLLLLRRQMHPFYSVSQDKHGGTTTLTITLSGPLSFPAIENTLAMIEKEIENNDITNIIYVDCQELAKIDFTVFHGLQQLKNKLESNNLTVRFVNCNSDPALMTLATKEWKEVNSSDVVHLEQPNAPLLLRETYV